MDSSNQLPPAKEAHDRVSKLVGGYTAFVAALLVTMFAKADDHPSVWVVVVISLLALSLPSLVALSLIDFSVRVAQGRKYSMFRGLAMLIGFYPAVIAIAILIGRFSVIAAILFGLLVAFWHLALFTVAIVGQDKASDI